MLPCHQQIPSQLSTQSFTPTVTTPEQQSLALLNNIVLAQPNLNLALCEEVNNLSHKVQEVRNDAQNMHQSLMGRVIELESERSNLVMRRNEEALANDVKSREYEERIKTLENELSSTKAELNKKNKIMQDYQAAFSEIKVSVAEVLKIDSVKGYLEYLQEWGPTRNRLFNTCNDQLKKLKIV